MVLCGDGCLGSCLLGNPFFDLFAQQGQGHRAIHEHQLVKFSHVKTLTQLGLGFGAQIEQGQLSDFLSGCLAGYHHVALDFPGYLVFSHARIGHHILNGLFAAPAFGVQARVYD